MPDPQVLTVAEAAHILRVSKAFAYELVHRGDLPALRFGRRIVIPRKVIYGLIGENDEGEDDAKAG